MSTPLSAYVLTYNSEKYIAKVLQPLTEVADEVVVIDSGSHDKTKEIAQKYSARWVERKFDSFKDQRNFAQEQCTHNWVLFVDSDEILDNEMVQAIKKIKNDDFHVDQKAYDAFRLKRRWYLFDKEVSVFYPITAPDFPIRLIRKDKVSFKNASNRVHETPEGFESDYRIFEGALHHHSCDSVSLLFHKLNQYTSLAALDMQDKGKTSTWRDTFGHSIGAWFKWYILKKGWRDGSVGFLLGCYAFSYTFQKYVKRLFSKFP
ncbi:MAG: glycosyltransferase family 2 protein [Halobacteriovoraceae bacterium]|nr:glycosyltransferase family 2 protein [Halobacteriovoraceae bacterium]